MCRSKQPDKPLVVLRPYHHEDIMQVYVLSANDKSGGYIIGAFLTMEGAKAHAKAIKNQVDQLAWNHFAETDQGCIADDRYNVKGIRVVKSYTINRFDAK